MSNKTKLWVIVILVVVVAAVLGAACGRLLLDNII